MFPQIHIRFGHALPTLALILLLTTSSACTTSRETRAALTFSAVGDGPRADADWAILRDQLERVDRDGRSAFLVHLGDITKGTDVLPESYYVRVADLLKKSKTPVFIVPGDNEWNDLDDPDQGWEFWNRHFLAFEKHFPGAAHAQRQPEHPENFAFEKNRVLIVGLNLVGGTVHDPAEWAQRHRDSAAWVVQNLDRHPGAAALVVCAQARPKDVHEDFFGPFCEAAVAFGKPVLYLHGDGHTYEVEGAWRKPNITRVQVDQVSKGPPLLVTVAPEQDTPFVFARLAPPKEDRMRRPNHFGTRHRGRVLGPRPSGGTRTSTFQ